MSAPLQNARPSIEPINGRASLRVVGLVGQCLLDLNARLLTPIRIQRLLTGIETLHLLPLLAPTTLLLSSYVPLLIQSAVFLIGTPALSQHIAFPIGKSEILATLIVSRANEPVSIKWAIQVGENPRTFTIGAVIQPILLLKKGTLCIMQPFLVLANLQSENRLRAGIIADTLEFTSTRLRRLPGILPAPSQLQVAVRPVTFLLTG